MLKVYFIISLVKKKEIILDLMLEERDCFFPLTRLRLMFGFIPRKSKGFWWIHAVLFFGTIQLFSSAAMDNGGKKGTQREFQVLFNHGTFFLWLTFLDSRSCVLRGSSHGPHPCGLREEEHWGLCKMVHYLLYVWHAVQNIFYFSWAYELNSWIL